ncbi:MAG TPA: DUF6491 family protein [Arenimonas sp.]|uniref:DUF6491 family protein n=1 Tax=Arenimonas sp. TaxID=1872635 RepID=UPI002BEAD3DB|nr:DUF6491 family protein [Arenimonas sp.]HMB56277.1 DUF6491 family protein [Arenimonas sp.]
MKIRWIPMLGLSLLAAACAGNGHRSDARTATRYTEHAGAEIAEFSFVTLYNWEKVDDGLVAVWTRPDTAYLLRLRNNCTSLDFQRTLALDGFGGRLRAGSGDVVAGQVHCRVMSIQPLDLAAIGGH